MRLAEWLTLVDTEHFEKTEEFELIRGNLEAAIAAVRWPVGSRDFCINPVKKGNGVKPIKEAFISVLEAEPSWPSGKRETSVVVIERLIASHLETSRAGFMAECWWCPPRSFIRI